MNGRGQIPGPAAVLAVHYHWPDVIKLTDFIPALHHPRQFLHSLKESDYLTNDENWELEHLTNDNEINTELMIFEPLLCQ